MAKLSKIFIYAIIFIASVMMGTIAVIKSFGLAYSCNINNIDSNIEYRDNDIDNAMQSDNSKIELKQLACPNCKEDKQDAKPSFYAKKDTAKYQSNSEITIGEQKLKTEAEAMILIEANSGRIIASKDADKVLPMASLTKIITAIVAIENCKDLDEKLEIPKIAQGIEGSSIYLKAGEKLSIKELLYGLMLRSGNDAAVAIATLISGSVENFMELCNQFCKSIGANNTNLVTPNGLHNENHYTTAADLATVSCYALKNKLFAEVVSTKQIRIDNQLGKFNYRDLINKNKFLGMMEGADGIKTGYTTKAGRCFVGSYTRSTDGLKLVCVLLNCKPMFQECQLFTQVAAKEYANYKLLDGGYTASINISGSKQSTVDASSLNSFIYPLTKTEYQNIEIKDTLKNNYKAPIETTEILGEVQIFLDKKQIFCDNIYISDNIKDDTYEGALDKLIDKF